MKDHIYVVWNNKGGVGKSTIVFNIAGRYAEQHPERQVLVLDLCPQANSTMMFLGGGTAGEAALLTLQRQTTPVTIVGYLVEKFSNRTRTSPIRGSFEVHVQDYNDHMPTNLWLVPGDGNLELIAPAISYYANAQLPPTAWTDVHMWARELIEAVTGDDDWTVFIDTNPSFAIYTELAIVAGTRLIVPFKADDSSRVATRALFDLLWGPAAPHPVYSAYTFATKAGAAFVQLPLCHVFVGNQFTQYVGAATAFKSMKNALTQDLYNAYVTNPKRYTDGSRNDSENDFLNKYVCELRDFNTTGVVAAHQGRLLSGLAERTYNVHGQDVQLDRRMINNCNEAVDAIVDHL